MRRPSTASLIFFLQLYNNPAAAYLPDKSGFRIRAGCRRSLLWTMPTKCHSLGRKSDMEVRFRLHGRCTAPSFPDGFRLYRARLLHRALLLFSSQKTACCAHRLAHFRSGSDPVRFLPAKFRCPYPETAAHLSFCPQPHTFPAFASPQASVFRASASFSPPG